MIKKLFALSFLLFQGFAFAQSINDYRYVSIPSKFEWMKETDQYLMSSTLKSFFQRYGLEAYLDNESLPMDFAGSPCNKMYVGLRTNNTLFTTKLTIELKDCTNKVLFTSVEGTSREKDFKTAYTQALRQAFRSFDAMHYKYNGKTLTEAAPAKSEVILAENFESAKPVDSLAKPSELDAVPIENGYLLKPKNPATPMKILRTSNPECYIVSQDNFNGVVINRSGNWYLEFYDKGQFYSARMVINGLKN